MNNTDNFWFAIKVFFKKWYFTILIPVMCMAIVATGLMKYFNHSKSYTATASFILTGASQAKAKTEGNLDATEKKIAVQKMNGELLTTYKGLVLHNGTLYSTLNRIEKKQKYTTQQILYKIIPKYKSNLSVSIPEGESLIFNVIYKGETAEKSARFVNELVQQTIKNEKKLLGTNSIKVFTKAVPPLQPDSKVSAVFKTTLASGVITWLIVFPMVMSLERKRIK